MSKVEIDYFYQIHFDLDTLYRIIRGKDTGLTPKYLKTGDDIIKDIEYGKESVENWNASAFGLPLILIHGYRNHIWKDYQNVSKENVFLFYFLDISVDDFIQVNKKLGIYPWKVWHNDMVFLALKKMCFYLFSVIDEIKTKELNNKKATTQERVKFICDSLWEANNYEVFIDTKNLTSLLRYVDKWTIEHQKPNEITFDDDKIANILQCLYECYYENVVDGNQIGKELFELRKNTALQKIEKEATNLFAKKCNENLNNLKYEDINNVNLWFDLSLRWSYMFMEWVLIYNEIWNHILSLDGGNDYLNTLTQTFKSIK